MFARLPRVLPLSLLGCGVAVALAATTPDAAVPAAAATGAATGSEPAGTATVL
jgi:hypothetical protein